MIFSDSLLQTLGVIGSVVVVLVLFGRWVDHRAARVRREDPRICPGCYNVVKRRRASSCPYCGAELYWMRRRQSPPRQEPVLRPPTRREPLPDAIREQAPWTPPHAAARIQPAREASVRSVLPEVRPHGARGEGSHQAPAEPMPDAAAAGLVRDVATESRSDALGGPLATEPMPEPAPRTLYPEALPEELLLDERIAGEPAECEPDEEAWEQEWEREEQIHRRKEFLYAFLAAVAFGWFLAAVLFLLR